MRVEELQQVQGTKKCPRCAGTIQSAAIVCKHCSQPLPGYEDKVPPPVAVDTPLLEGRQKKRLAVPLVLVMLAVAVVISVVAAVMLIVGTQPDRTSTRRLTSTPVAGSMLASEPTTAAAARPTDTLVPTVTESPVPIWTPTPTAVPAE